MGVFFLKTVTMWFSYICMMQWRTTQFVIRYHTLWTFLSPKIRRPYKKKNWIGSLQPIPREYGGRRRKGANDERPFVFVHRTDGDDVTGKPPIFVSASRSLKVNSWDLFWSILCARITEGLRFYVFSPFQQGLVILTWVSSQSLPFETRNPFIGNNMLFYFWFSITHRD